MFGAWRFSASWNRAALADGVGGRLYMCQELLDVEQRAEALSYGFCAYACRCPGESAR